jgi:translation elongation factor EF-G
MAPTLISIDITPKSPADRQTLARALQVLAAEDDQLEVRPGAEPDSTIIGATSEAHLEQIIDRLKREMSFAVSGFAEPHRAALCAARVPSVQASQRASEPNGA